jgi:hypothetical protein
LRKWVDDFLIIHFPHESWMEKDFTELTETIGVPWSHKKTQPLAPIQCYIGFLWNFNAKTVALPEEKVQSILTLLRKWTSIGATFLACEAASVHSKLVHMWCIFKLIRPFLHSIAKFKQTFKLARAKLPPPTVISADFSWISYLIPLMPNMIQLTDPKPLHIRSWGDTSSSFGIGAVLSNHWSMWSWAPRTSVGPKQTYDISWAEAVAIELGLCLAAQLDLLAVARGCPILIRSNNQGVVAIVNNGRARNHEANKVLKHIYTFLAQHCIRLTTIYVPSQDNISDTLSQGDITALVKAFPGAMLEASIPLPDHLCKLLLPWRQHHS